MDYLIAKRLSGSTNTLLTTVPVGSRPFGITFDSANLAATTLLIIVLRWFDGNYQGFIYGAVLRARVIERFLNLELTNQTTTRYEYEKLWLPKIALYGSFEAAVFSLALALLPGLLSFSVYLYFFIGAAGESIPMCSSIK